jgi:hypothetical protein
MEFSMTGGGRHDHMVVGFITTYVITGLRGPLFLSPKGDLIIHI